MAAPSASGRIDQLGATVGGVWTAFQVAQALEVVDQLRGRGRAELRSGGELGQPYAVDADVAEYPEVRFA